MAIFDVILQNPNAFLFQFDGASASVTECANRLATASGSNTVSMLSASACRITNGADFVDVGTSHISVFLRNQNQAGPYVITALYGSMVDMLNEWRKTTDVRTALFTSPEFNAAIGALHGSFGASTVPSLIANQQVTVQVPIKPVLSTAPPLPSAILSGSVSLLASLSVLGASGINTGSSAAPAYGRIDVTVKNTGLITLSGGTVFVHSG